MRNPTRSRLLRWTLLVAAAVFGTACGDDDDMMDPPPDGNQSPTAQITASPLSVPAGDNHTTKVTLDGSDSSDPDGDPLTFNWTVPSGNFVDGTTATDTVAVVTFPGIANYTVTLRVDDGQGSSDTAQVTIALQTTVASGAGSQTR